MQETITDILSAAVYAPSGDNSQPWKFEVEGNRIFIFCEPEKDNPKFNFHKRGTFIAHGALIENIFIISPSYGLKPLINYFPDMKNPDCTAEVVLEEGENFKDPLLHFIKLRSTNRKKYYRRKLTKDQEEYLIKSAAEIGIGEVKLASSAEEMKILAQAVSVNEIVMLEDRDLHDIFFQDIRWTDAEEQKFQTGLYLKTMELEKPKEFSFRLLRNWNVARVLNTIHIADFIARENSKLYSSGATFGAVLVPNTDENFLQAGRIFQRVWLKGVEMGLGLHPLTGIIYLGMRFMAGESENFSERHEKLVMEAYDKIKEIFQPREQVIAMMFRLGYGDSPTAKSSKLKPKIYFKTNGRVV